MSDINSLSFEELQEQLGDDLAHAIIAKRHNNELDEVPDGEYTDDEWTDILKDRPDLGAFDPLEFTKMSKDKQLMQTFSEVERETVKRWSDVEALRTHYALFEDFLYDCMTELMGFKCSDLQVDIARFLQSDVQYGMVQAQRSEGKSTIVAMFAVWQLIHDCKHRVLVISAGADVAAEIANWVIQIIMNWDILECLRPDRQHGDRASSKAFDIHWQLKGAEKSPSIACIGITANMQGRRADLLIPDDIESSKNGITETRRMALEHLSKDFTSICQKGRILYLGTPQTTDSIYKNLELRGYTIRVWTGRVPTREEAKHYGNKLAQYIVKMMDDPKNRTGYGMDGNRGAPTDPVIVSDAMLTFKEQDQGAAYFNLQYMLNTELSDENRYPLKPKNLIVMSFGIDKAPGEITWLPNNNNQINVDGKFVTKPQLHRPFSVSTEVYPYEGKHMYVDTAGGGSNGDETSATVTYILHGYVFLAEIKTFAGSADNENDLIELSKMALKHGVNSIDVEKNFGYGAFAKAWRPVLQNVYKQAGKEHCPVVEDVWETGQKEPRIIDTLLPLLGRHRLIVHEDVIEYDHESALKYPVEKRESYKLFNQMAKITRDRGALVHDDRLDSWAGSVRRWLDDISVNEKTRMEQKDTDENITFFKEWGGDVGNDQLFGMSSDRFRNKRR
jgi:hypothetical protein